MPRIAIVSDIHGNRTAFEAVLVDLRDTAPDLILHGGDLADSGAQPVEIVDRVRDLGWAGVVGNTDEMLFRPASLTHFASRSPQLRTLFQAIGEMATMTRERLGEERLAWLQNLPPSRFAGSAALVHGSPGNPWIAPAHDVRDAELQTVYEPLGRPVVVYAHIHRPYIRNIGKMLVANTGSVGLPHDGDRRASYLLLDGGTPKIRRVEYDIAREIADLATCGLPHAAWISTILNAGCFVMP